MTIAPLLRASGHRIWSRPRPDLLARPLRAPPFAPFPASSLRLFSSTRLRADIPERHDPLKVAPVSPTTAAREGRIASEPAQSDATLSLVARARRRVKPYLDLARLDKPIGTWLLLWPCAWSISMASYATLAPVSTWALNIALFGTGAIVMRGAGCVINDLWDRDIDKKVERTKSRPLASGQVTPFQALGFLGTQLTVGLGILTQLNPYSIALGASSLSLVVLYPLMKRITYWPQFVLGLAFNWGALLGSSAILGHTDWTVALPLYAGSVAWTIVYDTIYAHQDKTDDVHANVKSTALLFGDKSLPILSSFSVGFVSLLTLSGYLNGQGLPFYLMSVGGAAGHLAWQLRNVDWNDRASCWKFFGKNRDLGAIVTSGILVDYMLALNRIGTAGEGGVDHVAAALTTTSSLL